MSQDNSTEWSPEMPRIVRESFEARLDELGKLAGRIGGRIGTPKLNAEADAWYLPTCGYILGQEFAFIIGTSEEYAQMGFLQVALHANIRRAGTGKDCLRIHDGYWIDDFYPTTEAIDGRRWVHDLSKALELLEQAAQGFSGQLPLVSRPTASA